MKNHWRYDRNDEDVLGYAEYDTRIRAMKVWLGLDESTDMDEDNLYLTFEQLDTGMQVEIINYYIIMRGLVDDFNDWYEAMFGDDEEYDGYDHYRRDDDMGERIDEAYDRALDRELVAAYGIL